MYEVWDCKFQDLDFCWLCYFEIVQLQNVLVYMNGLLGYMFQDQVYFYD